MPITQDNTPKATIMVVDDDPMVLKMVATLLESCKYRVLCHASALEALSSLNKDCSQVDLVITDIRMPEMDGIHLLSSIRHISSMLPVLLMTGYTDFERVIEGIRNHAFDILLKPLDFQQLQWSITRALGHLKYLRMEDQYRRHLEERVIHLNRLVQEQFEKLQRAEMNATGNLSR